MQQIPVHASSWIELLVFFLVWYQKSSGGLKKKKSGPKLIHHCTKSSFCIFHFQSSRWWSHLKMKSLTLALLSVGRLTFRRKVSSCTKCGGSCTKLATTVPMSFIVKYELAVFGSV
jgi:hypothetical protein